MAEANNTISLTPELEQFLKALLHKIGNKLLEAQIGAYDETLSDEENLMKIHEVLIDTGNLPEEIATMAQRFNLVDLKPYGGVDESILTVKNLNDLLLFLLEQSIKLKQSLHYEAYQIKNMYRMAKPPVAPLSPRDSMMAHIASINALPTNDEGTELEKIISSEVAEDQDLPPDKEEFDKYMSIFSGEEYGHARENNSKGDIE